MKRQPDSASDSYRARSQTLSENGAGVTASDRHQGQRPFLKRVSVIGAGGAILIAVLGLLSYLPGLELLGSVREGYIPMAPSTAISFIVLAGILLCLEWSSRSSARLIFSGALAALVSFFGLLEVVGHFSGMDLNLEDALMPSAGYLGEIPVARMSYTTGAVFALAGPAALALILLPSQTRISGSFLRNFGGSMGSLVLSISFIFCLAYLFESPLFYGQAQRFPWR